MKPLVMALAMAMSVSTFAQEVILSDFSNWKMTDVASKGFNKEDLFSQMNRKIINSSICSNRSLVWAYDFKRNQDIDSGNIFLFYAKKFGEVGRKGWWYHVAPVINEKGSIFAMDAGFPTGIKKPVTPAAWLKAFSGSNNCKEIKATDTDLISRMFDGYVFPHTTSHGNFDCYYIYTPGGYWTPAAVAMGLLGEDEDGQPIRHVRDQVDNEEVLEACIEAFGTPRIFGGKNRCMKYLGL